MIPVRRKAAGSPAAIDPRLLEDSVLAQALLELHGRLELADQLGCLLAWTERWNGGCRGLGLGPGEERRSLLPLASTFAEDDPRCTALAPLDPQTVERWLAEGPQVFEGLGPFAAVAQDWPDEPPGWMHAVPLRGPSGQLAALLLLWSPDRPADAARRRIEALVELGRPATANALQVLAMRDLIIKDDTVSCFNRRHFEECLPEELSRASRFRTPVSLIFLDMDNLKQVNTHHGHSMGSRLLQEVSLRVRSKIRKFDKLFRFGGDEFCIVLPETEWHGAMEVAERVRDSIASRRFLMRELGDAKAVGMSASLGIASYPLHSRSQRELIEQADLAMQKIKKRSKNAIGIAEIARSGNDGS